MRFDVVRQPLIVAFITLLFFAVAAVANMGEGHLLPEVMIGPISLLGGYVDDLQAMWPLMTKVFCVGTLFLSGVILGRMTVRYALYRVHTYLAIPLYGIFACGIFLGENYLIGCLASALLVLSVKNFYSSFRNGAYGFNGLFRASFYLGVISLIYTPALLLAVIVPVAIVLFKRSAREMVVAVAGSVLPLLMVCYLTWAFGGGFTVPFIVLGEAFLTTGCFSIFDLDLRSLVLLGLLLFLFVCSVLCYFLDSHVMPSKSRLFLLFGFILFIVTGAMFFVPAASPTAAWLLAVPLAIVLPLPIVRLDRRVALFLYCGIVVLCALNIFW